MKIGSLFTGFGGLDQGVIDALGGGEVVWHSEFDPNPSRILAHHYPHIPNLGDITKIDWSTVEPVDVLTGGFPCQDVSLAGARKGMREGTRSGLWSHFALAIDALRPQLVVIENVRGLLSATAGDETEWTDEDISDLESAQGVMGEQLGSDRPVLRALGAVLGDLADIGYDAQWCGLRAADAGAPHGRYRIFILAYPRGQIVGFGTGLRESQEKGIGGRRFDDDGISTPTADTSRERLAQHTGEPSTQETGPSGSHVADGSRGSRANSDRRTIVADTSGKRGNESDNPARLCPEGSNGAGVANKRSPRPGATEWGAYEPAIRRWESVLNRPAPSPTDPDGKNGSHRLAPRFVEWMQGCAPGHVTNPAIWVGMTASAARNAQLKVLGNGVVRQQAAMAVRLLLGRVRAL